MDLDLRFYFQRLLRRLHYFLIFLVLGTVAGVTVATILPPSYSAEATLLVEGERIPEELAASTVQTEAVEALSIIRQRILTRGRLLELANDFDIYGEPGSDARRTMTADQIVSDLRRRISIVTSGGGRRGRTEATIVTVKFQAPTGPLTAEVVNELVTLILEQNAELRRGAAGETLEFFEDEVARLDQELASRSAEILAFEEANLDALPDSLDFRRSQQATLQERLQQLSREEARLLDRRSRLVTVYETTGRVFSQQEAPRTRNQAELAELERELSVVQQTLAPGNPRVRMLENRIAALQELVQAEQGALSDTAGQDAQLSAYEIQLADLDGEIDFIRDQREQIEAQMAQLQETIEATPSNSVRLETMQRDYAAIRARYEAAVANRARAETGDVIESLSKGQRISVIEQAVAPGSPDSPNRKLIAAGGVAAGGAVGLGLVLLLELMNGSILRPADLQKRLQIMPFGTLPLIRTPGEIVRRRAAIAFVFLAVATAVPAGLWYIQTEVMPLDLLFERALDRLGVADVLPRVFG